MRITNECIKIDYTYSLNSGPLEWIDTFRYLGVRFNRKLRWSDHVSEVKMKATRLLNLLRRSIEDVASMPRKELTLPLFVPTLKKHVHQSGLPI